MNTLTLIQLLQHTEPRLRLNAARILGMLDEVHALAALGHAFKRETDTTARVVMGWTGKRLQAAKASHYNTFEEIWRHYHIGREIEQKADEDKHYVGMSQHEMEMLHEQLQAEGRLKSIHSRNAFMLGLANRLNPLSGLAANTMMGGKPRTEGSLISTDSTADAPTNRRAMPSQPVTIDIRAHVQRLLSDSDAAMRRKAAITLGDLNNPSALSPMAQAFMDDPVDEVRTAAQHFGKRLYWNLIYWEMEQDGSLKQEIERRRAMLAEQTGRAPSNIASDPAQKKAIEDVLRRGLDKRRKR